MFDLILAIVMLLLLASMSAIVAFPSSFSGLRTTDLALFEGRRSLTAACMRATMLVLMLVSSVRSGMNTLIGVHGHLGAGHGGINPIDSPSRRRSARLRDAVYKTIVDIRQSLLSTRDHGSSNIVAAAL